MKKLSKSIGRGKKLSRFAALIMLLLLAFPTLVFAKDQEGGRVTLRCATTDADAAFSQETFRIYRVGDDQMRFIQPYASLADTTLSEAELGKVLSEYIKDHTAAVHATVTTDGSGAAELTLEKGVYLVVGEAVTYQGTTLYPQPLLLKLDWTEGDSLTGYVKYQPEEPNKPNTPPTPPIKTGDPPVLNQMMTAAVVSLLALLAVTRMRLKEAQKER